MEISADYWEFIQCAPVDLEFELNQDSSTSEQFNKRHLVLRREKAANYMKLRYVLQQGPPLALSLSLFLSLHLADWVAFFSRRQLGRYAGFPSALHGPRLL